MFFDHISFKLAYEIWFKQIIFELDSITNLLAKPVVKFNF
jgi:hypothetical protein